MNKQSYNGRRSATSKFVAACCLLVLAACSSEPIDGPSPGAKPAAPADSAVLNVRIVNSGSAPLKGMVPVAFAGPTLLSDTVSRGAPTDDGGDGQVTYPKEQWVYVRATDPAGKLVAINFAELRPGDARGSDDPVVLMMGATASVTATLQHADGSATSGEVVNLSMIHPAHGQWWHVESTADGAGVVRFDRLPSGAFALKLRIADATSVTIREAVLSRGEVKDLGVLSLQASE